MRILLLLSAFLAALTGGVAHARVAGPVAEVSIALVRAERAARVAPFVVAAAAVYPDCRSAQPRPDWCAPIDAIPLYADRLLI